MYCLLAKGFAAIPIVSPAPHIYVTAKFLIMSSRLTSKTIGLTAILFFLLGFCSPLAAQITLYTRTLLSGQTYTQITGGTVINTNAGLSVSMSQNQDDGAVLVTLPFTFTYNGNTFTQATFCTNGWVGMGNQLAVTAAQGRAPANLFTATVPNNTLAGWFGDMGANFPGVGSMVHGTVATGVYAFEWRNAVGSGFSVSATNLINFMIKIYGPASTTPGRIEFLYGTQTGALTTGRSIGIEDAVGGANRFINALNGSSTLTTTATAWPGNGAGYRFDPPVPCSGTPTAGTITGSTSACPGVNFTLSLAGHSTGFGITYQWQSKPTAGSVFTNIPAATSSILTTNISAPTDFRCIATCTFSSSSATTTAFSIGMNSYYVCYCKGSLGGNTSASIDSVSILQTSLANASPGTAAGSYTQYGITPTTTTSLQAGGLYYIYVKYGSSAIGSVWIDANQNGVFEASEWTQINTTGTSGLAVVRIPSGAVLGLTGMRVRSADAGATNAAGNACTSITTGETEDYVVTITPAPVNDIKVVTLLSPTQGSNCPFKTIDVKAVIYNNGTAPQVNFPIITQLNGPTTNTSIFTHTNALAPFTTDTITLTTYTLTFPGVHTVQTYVSLLNDVNHTNDSSVLFPLTIKPSANVPVVRNDSACYTTEGIMYVLPDPYKHRWYQTPSYTGLVFTGDTMKIPNIMADSFLYVCSYTSDDTASLTTTSAAGNGCGGGAMFNIVPNANVKVESFAALFSATGVQTVNVYYRLGTFAGNETNAGAWTLLGTASVNVSSTTTLTRFTVNAPLNLALGNTYGIYMNYNASYTNGTTTFSNADMSIQTGTGLCSAFGGTNAGRMFNGTVFYSKAGALCESPLLPIRVYAGPKPIVNLGVDLLPCENSDVILDAGHSGGTYIWNTMQTSQYINVKNMSGTYWVEVDKYCKASDTVTVTFQPLPSAGGIGFTRLGNTYTFTGSGNQNAYRAEWIFGDGSPNGHGFSTTHTYTITGPYTVIMILYNDCGGDTTILTLPLDVPKVASNNDNVLVYPNPAKDRLTVDFGKQLIKVTGYEIMNSIGAVVSKQDGLNIGNSKMDINTGDLPTGNYILKLIGSDTPVIKPFVINR